MRGPVGGRTLFGSKFGLRLFSASRSAAAPSMRSRYLSVAILLAPSAAACNVFIAPIWTEPPKMVAYVVSAIAVWKS
jgi:hypothetical protein